MHIGEVVFDVPYHLTEFRNTHWNMSEEFYNDSIDLH